jgi:hypothetical protein
MFIKVTPADGSPVTRQYFGTGGCVSYKESGTQPGLPLAQTTICFTNLIPLYIQETVDQIDAELGLGEPMPT